MQTPSLTTPSPVGSAPEKGVPRRAGWAVAAASAVTIIEGFDGTSVSVVGQALARDLHLSQPVLGAVFASGLSGVVLGSALSGWLVARTEALWTLIVAILLVAGADVLMAVTTTPHVIMLNRFVAFAGLGVAAPVAVSLAAAAYGRRLPNAVLTSIWAGIPVGGILGAGWSYFAVAELGWRSIFVLGGLIASAIVILAWVCFRGVREQNMGGPPASYRALFTRDRAGPVAAMIAMCFFGYMATSVILYWTPALVEHRGGSPRVVATTYALVNLACTLALVGAGLLADRIGAKRVLPLTWSIAGVLLVLLTQFDGLTMMCALIVLAAAMGASGQALAVATSSRAFSSEGLAATAIGVTVSAGRIGQAAALFLSARLLQTGFAELTMFIVAGGGALLAALFAIAAVGVLRQDR